MQKLYSAAKSGTSTGWGTSLPGSMVVVLVLGKHMFHQGWENTESGPCLHQEVSYQAGQYSPHHLGTQLHGQVHHYAPHHCSTHPLSCGCQPLGRCWRSCQAAHMYIYHVLRHIDNLVGPPPPPVLVPAGDHEEDHGKYVDTICVGSSEFQDRCE